MMELTFQTRTEAKIKWAVNAYCDWRTTKVDSDECPEEILYADIRDTYTLTKENFEFALCRFIVEVKKCNDGGDYPGRTLYQMACALQNHLKKKNIHWKILHGDGFVTFNRVLDKVMQERSAQCIGTIRKQAQVISLEFENRLWLDNILGEDTPDKLRSTVLYLLGVNCALRAGDEHYALRRPGECMESQLSFEVNSVGVRCLVYREDTITKTNKGGLKDMQKERKIVWIKPSSNVNRCPVRLVEKYIKLLPRTGTKPNLYLHSLKHPKPTIWYCETPLWINKVRSVVATMLKNAGLDGFFTNHSLCRMAATRLFQAGQNVKLIREVTGHRSNAIEKYEITSDEQRMELSKIIQGEGVSSVASVGKNPENYVPNNESKAQPEMEVCEESGVAANDQKEEISSIISNALKSTGNRKARVTITIDLID